MPSDQGKALCNLLQRSAFCSLVRKQQLDVISIRHPAFSAEILPQGAQITSFVPTGDSDWIWLSPTAEYLQGKPLRGGVPVCWPWFGDADHNPEAVQQHIRSDQAAAHGFARGSTWQLLQLTETADSVTLEFELDARQPGDFWNGSAIARFVACFSRSSLRMTLTTENCADTDLSFSQALHTYFPVSDISLVRISGLHDSQYIDTLTGWTRKQQTGDVQFGGETDRIYLNEHTHLELLYGNDRRSLEASGSNSTIVWNPHIEKSRRLSQFPDDGWKRMLCIETANAADDAVTLKPGQSHSLSVLLGR